ncbi:MAG: insulinase family protein [Candidatus Shikimatogenerans sp. Ttur]|uniref:Insulinase family protein n=1 Tax=Candidatus Shikimatogenerans sp. Ttur TaxID=3158569 RepID=A0AAU7ZXN5_9FLAO
MNNINISKKKKYYIDINYKPIYILSNGIKIFLIKKKYNNTLVNIELKINHPIINNKYIIIFKIIFKDLLKLGTKKLNIKKINNIIDNNQINFLLTFEGFKINILKKNIKNFFLLIIDIILNLNFKNEKKFIKLLKNIIFLLKIYKYNYELIINNLKNNILYENNNIPYNFFLKKKDLFTIKLNNVKKIYKKYFIPNNSYLFFYGDISKKKVISLSKKYFLK